MATEQLTDEERADLDNHETRYPAPVLVVAKALRLLDAHAADRAALVAQLEQLTTERNALVEAVERRDQGIADLRAHIAELTREREEARVSLSVSRACRKVEQAEGTCLTAELEKARSGTAARMLEIERLQDALAAAEKTAGHVQIQHWCALVDQTEARAEAAEAQVAELTRERDEASGLVEQLIIADEETKRLHYAEVTRLTAALAAAEEMVEHNQQAALQLGREKADALDRVRELEAALNAANSTIERWSEGKAAESEGAALRDSVRQVGQENDDLRAEVERLTALYQQERDAHDRLLEEAEDYSSKCQTLRTERDDSRRNADAWCEKQYAAESRIAAANALLGRSEALAMVVLKSRRGPRREWHDDADTLACDIRAHLAAQPATAPATQSKPDPLPKGWRRTLAGGLAWCGEDQPATAPVRDESDEGCECPGAHECGVTTSTAANERKARTEAESELAQLRERVANALATFDRDGTPCGAMREMAEALRGS